MKRLLEESRHLVLIAVVFSLGASIFAFLLGASKAVAVIVSIVMSLGKDPAAAIALIEVMDIFMIAAALLIFSIGMYELFIGELSLPKWLVIHDIHDLKTKLGSVIILVMAVTFLKHLVRWSDPQGTFFFGLSVAVVTAVLIAFSHFGKKD